MNYRWGFALLAIVCATLTGRPCCGDQSNPLPPGVHTVWDLAKAHREATTTRERVCINGLWRWQPAPKSADRVQLSSYPSGSFEATYPNIAAWINAEGWIELGYEPNTDTYARALDAGGMVWSGGHKYATLNEILKAMDKGLRDQVSGIGI